MAVDIAVAVAVAVAVVIVFAVVCTDAKQLRFARAISLPIENRVGNKLTKCVIIMAK